MKNMKSDKRAPDFVSPDVNGEDVSLEDLLRAGQRVLIVFLHRLG